MSTHITFKSTDDYDATFPKLHTCLSKTPQGIHYVYLSVSNEAGIEVTSETYERILSELIK